jgi:hypothetical protein
MLVPLPPLPPHYQSIYHLSIYLSIIYLSIYLSSIYLSHLGDGEGWAPIILEDIETYRPPAVNVA